MNNYEKVKEWRKNNPEKVLEQARRYRKKHPETNKKAKEKYRSNNLDLVRERDRKAQENSRRNNPQAQRIRYENWRARKEAKLWDLAGRPRPETCELCDGNDYPIVFDHCHKLGHFRGWLCDRCNKTLGIVKDSIDLLRKMADYLEKHNGKINIKETKCLT